MVSACWLLSSCGLAASEGAAASVGDVEYSEADLREHMSGADSANPSVVPREFVAQWLSRWVLFTAVEMELQQRGVQVTPEHENLAMADISASLDPSVPRSAVLISQQAVIRAAERWAIDSVPDVTEADIDQIGLPRLLCSRHILVIDNAQASAVLERLDAGEDFGELATEVSLDPGASQGGDLGCLEEGSLVAPFEEAAYAAEPGVPVLAETTFGVHVILVESAGAPDAVNHPQLDPEFLQQFRDEKRAEMIAQASGIVESQRNALLVDLTNTAQARYGSQVSVNDRYGVWDPEEFTITLGSAGPGDAEDPTG